MIVSALGLTSFSGTVCNAAGECGSQKELWDRKRRRRCRGRRLVKNDFVFYKRIPRMLRSVQYANRSKNLLRLNMQRRRTVLNGNAKTSRRHPRSVDGAELGYFTLLFCRRRQRNVQKVITHVHSYCFAH